MDVNRIIVKIKNNINLYATFLVKIKNVQNFDKKDPINIIKSFYNINFKSSVTPNNF